MFRKSFFKKTAILLISVFILSTIGACSSPDTKTSNSSSNTSNLKSSGEKKITWNLSSEPQTIDPNLNAASVGSTVIRGLFEALIKQDPSGKWIPGCIEEMPLISSDGLIYRFKLKKDAKWSDGVDLQAKDFVYSYLRMLNPDTGAEFASDMFLLKNGKKYFDGEIKDSNEVGVKALDNKTLELTLENPVPYFLDLAARSTFLPLREDIVSKGDVASDAWSRDPNTCIGNGPFKLKEWNDKDNIVIVRNENYWDNINVNLDEIEFKMIDSGTTALSAFKNGEIDYMENIPPSEVSNLKADGLSKTIPYLATAYYALNLSEEKASKLSPEAAKALSDVRVRKALAYAIDRNSIVKNITGADEVPALYFVPKSLNTSNGDSFTTKDYFKDNNVEEAKKLLAEAGYPDGKNFPKLEILSDTNELYKATAEAIQDMWKTNLGIEVELRTEEWKTFQTSVNTNGEFLVARQRWIADYEDPYTFLSVFSVDNKNYGYKNDKFENLLVDSEKEVDPTKRTEILRQAQDILMEDMALIPIYDLTLTVAIQPRVIGFNKSSTGLTYFEYMDVK